MKDHIIICGWSDHGRRLVMDLLALTSPPPMTVVCDRRVMECPPVPERAEITHIKGNPTSAEVLSSAGIKEARTIVILSDQSHGGPTQTLDARTILTALTISELNSSVHVIAELRNETSLNLATSAGVDEWILADQFSGVMLSQSLQSSGLSELFTALFETGAGSALTEEAIPAELVGTSFSEAISMTIAFGLGALAGIRRGENLHLPPKQDLILVKDDRLLLVHQV